MTVKHLVFATGFGSGFPKMPGIPEKVGHPRLLSLMA